MVWKIFKPWTWFRRTPKTETTVTKDPKEPSKPPTLYPSKNMILVTTETDLKLRPCKVQDDHKIRYGKKEIDIKEDRPAHILDMNLMDLMYSRKHRLFARLFGLPQWQTFRVYTAQQEGEYTHDPNVTAMTEEQKMRIEKMIQLKAVAIKAEISANIMAGLKGKGSWWELLGWGIIITIIVAIFLFAFQIQPNL